MASSLIACVAALASAAVGRTAGAVLAGDRGARADCRNAVGARRRHELSSRNCDRAGRRRGNVPMSIMAPPQHGQGAGPLSEALLSIAPVTGASSKLRQSASLAARWPLARKP